jgi:hypothetical protein
MKLLLKSLIFAVLCTLVFYLTLSLFSGSIYSYNWDIKVRVFGGFIGIALLVVSFILALSSLGEEQV